MANIKTLPTLKYTVKKERVMVSLRLPDTLVIQIEKIAESKGWSKTDVMQFALDLFVQNEKADK